jgi:hypothetical protein
VALILTTGSVENAATNPSVNLFVKVLNNNDTQPVQAEITLYSLNGAKNVIGTAVREVPPLSSDYEIFDITDVLQFEVQVSLNHAEQIFVSVWGKDADASLVAAHRFVPAELSIVATNDTSTVRNRKTPPSSSNSHRRRRM